MTKSEKRERAVRQNPRNVRFDDLDTFLRSYNFIGDPASSHVTYRHARYADLRLTVVKPHGGLNQVKPAYVREAVVIVDAVKVRIAEEAK